MLKTPLYGGLSRATTRKMSYNNYELWHEHIIREEGFQQIEADLKKKYSKHLFSPYYIMYDYEYQKKYREEHAEKRKEYAVINKERLAELQRKYDREKRANKDEKYLTALRSRQKKYRDKKKALKLNEIKGGDDTAKT